MSPLYLGLGIAGVGLLFALVGFFARRKAARISAAPLLKTIEATRTSGAASAEGAVRTQQPLMAPCSNIPCVYYRLTIEAKIKSRQGNHSTTTLADERRGSVFTIDDGSGPLVVQALEGVTGDLEQSYKGVPPGGPGLGSLAGFVQEGVLKLTAINSLATGEEILGFQVTEKIIRADGKLFVLGHVQQGQLVKPPTGNLIVSTRGRDAMVGSSKRNAMGFMVIGGLAVAGGTTVAILRPGEARACVEPLKDIVGKCAITSAVVEEPRLQPDGSKKPEKFRRDILKWEVTKAGKYKLSVTDPKKRNALPTIQVENSLGIPMNLGLGLGFGAGAYSFDTTTANLSPGNFTVYVFSNKDGPETLVIDITEAPEKK